MTLYYQSLSSDNLWVDAGAYGSTRTDVAIQAALTTIGSDEKTLYIAPGTWTVNPAAATITVPSNVTIRVEHGAILSVSTGKTLAINGKIEAGRYQIFSGDGTVTLAALNEAIPNWWADGGDGTSGTPWTSTMDSAGGVKASLESGAGMTRLLSGYYSITVALTVSRNTWLVGEGVYQSYLDSTVGEAVITTSGATRLDGFRVDGNTTAGAIGIRVTDGDFNDWGTIYVRNCPIAGVRLDADGAGANILYGNFGNITAHTCGIGIDLLGDATQHINANRFGMVQCHSCTTGVQFGARAAGNTFQYLLAETCTNGILVDAGANCWANVCLGGWLESNTTNITLTNDIGNFTFLGSSDKNAGSLTVGKTRSNLIPGSALDYSGSANNFVLDGQWYYSDLYPATGCQNRVYGPVLGSMRLENSAVTDDATPSVSYVGVLFVTMTGATAITNLADAENDQVVLIIAANSNVSITDGGNFKLSANWTPAAAGDNILLYYSVDLAKWIEISRTSV